jgi:5-formyltetrahydrofolate cyclo-ligase
LDKSSLRKLFKERLKALSMEERNSSNALISSSLKKLNLKTTDLGVYIPLEDEVDWSVGFEKNQEFAVVGFKTSNEIAFYKSTLEQLVGQMSQGREFKVPVQVSEVVPRVLLIPGIGFSEQGGRLGRGKGFYDKYLENFKGLKIGVTYEALIAPTVPMDVHDRYMDWIVTEKGIRKFSPFNI